MINMKKIIFTILISLLYLNCFSQYKGLELPTYYIESGDTIGILISVEQLQNIDNKLELLNMLEKLGVKCDSLEKFYIKVVDDQKDVINDQKNIILNLTESNENLERQLKHLKEKNSNLEEKIEISESILKLEQEKVINWKDKSKSNSKKKWSLLGTTILFSITTVLLSISAIK